MNKRRFVIAGTILLALCASCWMPPYDDALKDSESVIRKLGAPARSFSAFLRRYEAADGYYLPPRDPASFQSGFWVIREDGALRIKCVVQDLMTLAYGFAQTYSWSVPDRYGDSAVIMPAASDPSILFVLSNDLNGFNRLTRDAWGNLSPSGNFPILDQAGAGVAPVTSLEDRYCSASVSSGIFSVFYNNAGSTEAFTGANIITPGYAFSMPVSPAFAALSPGSKLYLSAELSDGSVSSFEWSAGAWAAAPIRLAFIDKKLNGILSDGRLFARTDDSLSVYDPAAQSSFTIATGKLRFLYERYDTAAGVWLCVFSRATTVVTSSKSDDKSEYKIEIYETPTANLSRLADS